MRRLTSRVWPALLIATALGAISPVQARADALAEGSRLLTLGNHAAAEKILRDLVASETTAPEVRFEAAWLLSVFPLGTGAYAERSTWIELVLGHPLASRRLDTAARDALIRSRALALFQESRWADARREFNALIKSAALEDRAVATMQLGWIDINEGKPESAFRRWSKALSGELGRDAKWRPTFVRDLGQVWVESLGKLPLIELYPADFEAFKLGLSAGVRQVWSEASRWSGFRARAAATSAGPHIRDLLLEDTDISAEKPCEFLAWQPLSAAGFPVIRAAGECWKSSATHSESTRAALLKRVRDSEFVATEPGVRRLRAELAEASAEPDLACEDYLVLGDVSAVVENCSKASPRTRARVEAQAPLRQPTYLPLLSAALKWQPNAVAREGLLLKTYPDPESAIGAADRTPLLTWLELVQTASPASAPAWLNELFTSDRAWKKLDLGLDAQNAVKIDLALKYRAWNLAIPVLAQSEAKILAREKLARAYRTVLEQAVREVFHAAPALNPALAPDGTLARSYLDAAATLTAPSPDRAVLARALKNAKPKDGFLKSARGFLDADTKLSSAKEAALDLKSHRFPLVIRRKILALSSFGSTVRKLGKTFPPLATLALGRLHAASDALATQIQEAPVPSDWSKEDRDAWSVQREAIAKKIGQWGSRS